MADDTTTATTQEQGADNGAASAGVDAGDTPPKWFLDYTEKNTSQMKDVFRRLGKLGDERKDQDPAKDKAPAMGGVSKADLDAAMRLGRLTDKLPELAQKRIATILEAGRSYAEAAEFAEALLEISATPASGAPATGESTQTRTGFAATAAPNRATVGGPRTQSELVGLMRSDRKRYDALMKDPTFDPLSLPMR